MDLARSRERCRSDSAAERSIKWDLAALWVTFLADCSTAALTTGEIDHGCSPEGEALGGLLQSVPNLLASMMDKSRFSAGGGGGGPNDGVCDI